MFTTAWNRTYIYRSGLATILTELLRLHYKPTSKEIRYGRTAHKETNTKYVMSVDGIGVIGLRCQIIPRRKRNMAVVVVVAVVVVEAAEVVVIRRGTKILIILRKPTSRIRREIPAIISNACD